MISTRTVEECEHLVALWNAGERDQVIAAFGGAEPSEHFLETFKSAARKPGKSEQPARSGARKKKNRRVDGR